MYCLRATTRKETLDEAFNSTRGRAQKSLIQREHSRQASSRQHCTTLWVTGLKAGEGDVRDGKRDCTLPGKRARGAHNKIAHNRARERCIIEGLEKSVRARQDGGMFFFFSNSVVVVAPF